MLRTGAKPAHRTNCHPHQSVGAGKIRAQMARGAGHPHFFKLIEIADFRTEHMDDHILRIQQNPVALILAFDLARTAEIFFQPFGQLFGDCPNLT